MGEGAIAMRVLVQKLRYRSLIPRIGLCYSYRDSTGLVLREDARLTNLAGFFFRIPGPRVVWVYLRRGKRVQ